MGDGVEVGVGVGVGAGDGVGVGVGVGVGDGVGFGMVVGTGVGAYVGIGGCIKPPTAGGVPTGVGLADLGGSVVGSALGLTSGEPVGLAMSSGGVVCVLGLYSDPARCSTNRRKPIATSATNPLSGQIHQSSGNFDCIPHLPPENLTPARAVVLGTETVVMAVGGALT